MELAKEKFVRLVQAEDAEALKQLLDAESALADIINDPLFSFGKPAVVQARNNLSLIDVLLENGADINARSDWDAGSYGVLNETAEEAVDGLVERGAVFDLHAMVEHDRMELVQAALDAEPTKIHERGPDGQLPLHYAQNVEMARLLLERGAEIDARCVDHGSTAAHYMVCERPEVCRFLIDSGCETDVLMACALGLKELALEHLEKDPSCVAIEVGKAPYEGHIYVWKLPSVTPYQIALAKGYTELAALIYERLDEKQKFLASCWSADETKARAILDEHPDMISELGDRIRIVADAAWEKMADAVRLMLDLGFPVNTPGDHQSTPLDRACVRGYAEVVEVVLPFGPDLGVHNEFGGVPLTTALWGACHWCEGDYERVVARLMKEGAPAHLRDEVDGDKGYGLLVAWMADEGSVSIIETLLKNGAPVNGRNRQGETALEVARRKERDDVVALLESYSA